MQCDNECCVRVPIREVKSNLVGVKNLLLAGTMAGERRSDGTCNTGWQLATVQRGCTVTSQLFEDSLDLLAD